MSVRARQTIPAPQGAATAPDPTTLPLDRAQALEGLAPFSTGRLKRVYWRDAVIPTVNAGSATEGIFYYRGDSVEYDRLLYVQSGRLYEVVLAVSNTYFPDDGLAIQATQTNMVYTPLAGWPFKQGFRVRAVQFRREMIFVQDGGTNVGRPLRYIGPTASSSSVLQMVGIEQPTAPTVTAPNAGSLTGTFSYRLVYLDDVADIYGEARESSPSSAVSSGSITSKKCRITHQPINDPQITYARLYRTTNGGTVYYQATNLTAISGCSITSGGDIVVTPGTTWVVEDDTSDTAIVNNRQSPEPGQNDAPNDASLIAVWGRRIVLNDLEDEERIQVSNLDSPTQFASFTDVTWETITDGWRVPVVSSESDRITALSAFGSSCGIWKTRSFHVMDGSRADDFIISRVNSIGCTATDSVVPFDNFTLFKSEDGLYRLSFVGGLLTEKVSRDYDDDFIRVAVSVESGSTTFEFSKDERERLAIARGYGRRYYLSYPPYEYIYEIDRDAWMRQTMPIVSDGGYPSMCLYYLKRVWDILIIDERGSLPLFSTNYLSILSHYRLGSDEFLPLAWRFRYRTRPFEGEGPHRARLKRFLKVTVYGKESGGARMTMTLNMDGRREKSYEIDTRDASFDPVGPILRALWRERGILYEQEIERGCEGYVLDVTISGYAERDVEISDIVVEYVPIN